MPDPVSPSSGNLYVRRCPRRFQYINSCRPVPCNNCTVQNRGCHPCPFAYTIDFTRYLPFPAASYMTPIHYNNFPVFPWFGFMSAGVLSARPYTDAMERSSEISFMNILAVSGAVMVFAGPALMIYLKDALNFFQDVWPNILFFTERLGCVWVPLWLCHHFSRNLEEIHALILYPSRQSLVV